MMIKYVLAEEVLPLRSMVLRNGLAPDQCIFPTDEIAGIFHLGCFVEDQLISIATFFPEDYPEKGESGFRLRGMATNPEFAGKGYGAALIKFAAQELTSANASYIWCNARSSAVVFYKKQGYEIISDEFEVPGIGPHFNMLKSLK
ncbi:GNAT family N-acetyltransferase [Pedobacter metabolipauper]|uniref:Putative GNAT family N-acyltransferase n=1 Tax=Pedobacter metabolipauper TaxID=425513 RepID=A0A4R6SUG6_9SPHI|nr:GNAT family N-acetyltransferase [Pedobacter metabolipauper]TDQ08626.1 putative GNAT family N-acyltransferase [Pedobacter metabolipauper]